MGRADMTRFDFNALQFIMSEDVQCMTDAERGQYVTLLCHAWLLGKECSLPDNLGLFSRWCNCERVSDNVIKKFERREDGRLYNKRLLEDWNEALERVERASELANRRWDKARTADSNDNTNADASVDANGYTNGYAAVNATVNAKTIPKPTQTNPNQPKPTQLSSKAAVGDSQNPEAVFVEAKKKYHRIVGKSIGSLGSREREWIGLVTRHGAELVIAAVVKWATDNKDFLKKCAVPVAHFLKNNSDYLDLVSVEREAPHILDAGEDRDDPDDFLRECGVSEELISTQNKKAAAR